MAVSKTRAELVAMMNLKCLEVKLLNQMFLKLKEVMKNLKRKEVNRMGLNTRVKKGAK